MLHGTLSVILHGTLPLIFFIGKLPVILPKVIFMVSCLYVLY